MERSDMSGPIVRTGTTPEYWKNWDSIFGGKKGKATARPAKAAKKPAKAKPAKKAAKKK
jgi:hypothetical protein